MTRYAGSALLVLLAVLTLSGCSPSQQPLNISRIEVNDGTLVARSDVDWHFSYGSTDGGRTWGPWTGTPTDRTQSSQCVPNHGSRCYRVVQGELKVLESNDGSTTWTTSWEVPQDRVDVLTRALGDPPRSVALAVQETASGHVVVVANGSDGVAVRDEQGVWRRYGLENGLSTEAALPLDSAPIGHESWVALLAGVWTLIAGFAIATRTYGRSSLTAVAIEALFSTMIGAVVGFSDPVTTMLGVFGSLITLGLLIAAWVVAANAKIGGVTMGAVLGAGVLTALGVVSPFRLWGSGLVQHYDTALMLAAGLGLALAATGLVLVRRTALAQSSL